MPGKQVPELLSQCAKLEIAASSKQLQFTVKQQLSTDDCYFGFHKNIFSVTKRVSIKFSDCLLPNCIRNNQDQSLCIFLAAS